MLTDVAGGNDYTSFKLQKKDRSVRTVKLRAAGSMGAGHDALMDGSYDVMRVIFAQPPKRGA
jgi:hypothetical protein